MCAGFEGMANVCQPKLLLQPTHTPKACRCCSNAPLDKVDRCCAVHLPTCDSQLCAEQLIAVSTRDPALQKGKEEETSHLHLETTALSATSGVLPLPVLPVATNVRLGVLVGAHAEVLDGLTGVLRSADEDRVLSGRGALGELVERKALTASSDNARAGSLGETEGGDAELGKLDHAVVVRDRANDDDSLGGRAAILDDAALVAGKVDNARDRDWRAVDLGHIQPAEHSLVEARVSAAGEEAVELESGSTQ